ncbi:MAG: phosphoglycerate dehydrogenase, partial [Pyrinomonadaceae bacterium]|nr:phosphoglycerate dehydrogenase [Sphingobacteriaceae bacterium]
MLNKKILIADKLHPVFKEEAKKLGYVVDEHPEISREETLRVIHNYSGLAIRTKFNIDREIIDAGSSLKFVARAGAGMDNIDIAYAEAKGITCINAPEGNRAAVAEHAIGMLLSLMNNLRKADIEVRNGVWNREGNRGY